MIPGCGSFPSWASSTGPIRPGESPSKRFLGRTRAAGGAGSRSRCAGFLQLSRFYGRRSAPNYLHSGIDRDQGSISGLFDRSENFLGVAGEFLRVCVGDDVHLLARPPGPVSFPVKRHDRLPGPAVEPGEVRWAAVSFRHLAGSHAQLPQGVTARVITIVVFG